MEKSFLVSEEHLYRYYSTTPHLCINKEILKAFGPEVAIYISNLIDKRIYFKEKGLLKDDKWFFLLNKQQTEQTGMSVDVLQKCKKTLIEKKVMETKKMGIPAKEWYSINMQCIMNLTTVTDIRDSDVLCRGITDTCIGKSPTLVSVNHRHYIRRPNSKETKSTSSSVDFSFGNKITPAIFDKFWKIYPKHPDKGKALSAWNKLCSKKERPTWVELKKAILSQKETSRWQEKKYIPHPTTWLNQNRWLDDPSEMVSFEKDSDDSGYMEERELPEHFKKAYKHD